MNASVDGTGTGREAVATIAPAAAEALDLLEATVWVEVDPALADAATRVTAAMNAIAPLPRPADLGPSPWDGRDAREWRAFGDLAIGETKGVPAAALEFAEQFAIDVSSVSDEQRAALFATLGADAVAFAQAVYAADIVPRVRATLDRFFGPSEPPSAAPIGAHGTLRGAMEDLIRVVPALQGLDPVLTELVRLRGARQHRCRMCQALRSHSAFVAGADDEMFEAVDDYSTSALTAAQKAALGFTDAFIWTPGALPDAVVAALTEHFTPSQVVELVLDIARNATNKLAVSLAADGTTTTEGYEVYDVAADGTITYGLTKPVV